MNPAPVMTVFRTSWNMTGHSTHWKLWKFIKVLIFSVIFSVIVLLLVATVRTFTLDVDSGLQLGKWENTTTISLHLRTQQRKNLLANFKGKKINAVIPSPPLFRLLLTRSLMCDWCHVMWKDLSEGINAEL